MTLSKSHILAGRHCRRRLWLEIRRPDLIPPPAANSLRYLQQGLAVGARARAEWPDGRWPEIGRPLEAQLADPAVTTLFEATFEYRGASARVDILTRLADGRWHLIEVKSSGGVKEDYLVEVALQAYILTGAGVDLGRVSLWTINKDSSAPALADLFIQTDMTAASAALLSEIEAEIAAFHAVVAQADVPAVALGKQCKECPLQAHCWQHLGDLAVFNIPGLAAKKAALLSETGIEHLADLPPNFQLSAAQTRYREVMLTQTAYIDQPAIVRALGALSFPLYFLDFEADGPALPRYAGAKPFQQFPFQFSCHVRFADGRSAHIDYLHDGADDPRPALLHALLNAIGRRGSIVVFNATFERTILRELAAAFPQHAAALTGMIDRLWDQQLIFKQQHYLAPGFVGSASLKAVLPVLVPELAYDDLVVRDGSAAVAKWNEFIDMPPGPAREQLRADLRAYCTRDTQAMVALHDFLVDNVVRRS